MHITALLLLGFTGAQLATSLPVPAESAPALADAANIPQSGASKAPHVNVPPSPSTNSNPVLPGNTAGVAATDALAHRSENVHVANVDLENRQVLTARLGPDPEQVQKAHENDRDDNDGNDNDDRDRN